MKRKIFLAAFLTALAALSLSSCIIIDWDTAAWNNFNHSLRGTWKTTPGAFTEETLDIQLTTITVNGTVLFNQPLHGFTPGFAYKGHSEETLSTWNEKKGTLHFTSITAPRNTISYLYERSGLQELLILEGSAGSNMQFLKQ